MAVARAIYKRAPSGQELATIGLRPEDYADEEAAVEVWPENLPAYDLWVEVGDQWRMGPGGPVAIDLIPVFHELDRMGLEKEAYDDMVLAIKTMARVALEEIHGE
jgi:hypothetical protein